MSFLYPNPKTLSVNPIKSLSLALAILLSVSTSFAQAAPAPLPQIVAAAEQDEIVSFKVQKDNHKMILDWVSSTDKATSHYVIQASFDGKTFDDKAILFTSEDGSATTCKHKYADNVARLTTDKIYYRLKMVGMNGAVKYSSVEMMSIKQTTEMSMAVANR